MPDIRENVINDVVIAMSPLMDSMELNMLEEPFEGLCAG